MPIPDAWTMADIDRLLARGDLADLIEVPIAITNLGTPDAHWSESVCLTLAEHEHPDVRANAVLGLGHLARVAGRMVQTPSPGAQSTTSRSAAHGRRPAPRRPKCQSAPPFDDRPARPELVHGPSSVQLRSITTLLHGHGQREYRGQKRARGAERRAPAPLHAPVEPQGPPQGLSGGRHSARV